jgi:hypothetical protein
MAKTTSNGSGVVVCGRPQEFLSIEQENELSFSFLTGTTGYKNLYENLTTHIPVNAINYYEKVVLFCETNQSIPEYVRSQYAEPQQQQQQTFVDATNEASASTLANQSSCFRALFRSPTEINGLITSEILNGNEKFVNLDKDVRCTFQRKATIAKRSDVIPIHMEGQILFVDFTVKESIEYELPYDVFKTKVINQSSDADGSFRKIAGVDRKCWCVRYDAHIVRVSLGKRYSFAGTSIARSPNDVVYYVEFEIEYDNKCPIKNEAQLINKCIADHFTIHDLTTIIKDGYNLTVKQTECLDTLFDTFSRNFVSINDFKHYCCSSTNCSQLYLAPKWDGIRGFGVWHGDAAIVYTTLGLRAWDKLPIISPQKILFQAEVFINNTVDGNDDFIVTEIFGVAKQSINMLYSTFIRQNMYSGRSVGAGLYNGTTTAINGQLPTTDVRCTYRLIKLKHSISVIASLHEICKSKFTSYIRDNDGTLISQILNNEITVEQYHIPTTIKNCSSPSDKKEEEEEDNDGNHKKVLFEKSYIDKGCDGLIGICVSKDGNDGVYVKLKKYQTIELEYDILNPGKCKSRDGTQYNVLGLPSTYNWSSNAYTQRFICLEARYNNTDSGGNLEFIKWRFDKVRPDNDVKINKIMLSL